jgi:predicted ribosomally synthesized peptide with nif11-like leader
MSIEDLTAFFAKLESDPSLQERALALQGAPEPERLDGLCRLAADHGFEVTPADWEHEDAGGAVAALDDDTLKDVAGGNASCSALGSAALDGRARPMG